MKKLWILIVISLFVVHLDPASAVKNWEKGKKAYDKGEYGEAIVFFKKAAEADQKSSSNFRWLGHAYYENRQFQDAVAAYKQALALHSDKFDSEILLWLSQAYGKLGQLDSAISSIKKYIELKPEDPEGFGLLAMLNSVMKRHDEAIMAAKRAVELKPDRANYHWALGEAFRRNKQYNEALSAVKKAVELDPKKSSYQDMLGDLYYARRDYAHAALAYKKAVELEPNNTEFLWELADNYRLAGKYDEAISTISQAIELEGKSGQLKDKSYFFAMRSIAYRHKGNSELALQDAEKAISLDPAKAFAQVSRGAAYLDQGNFDDAVKLLSQVKNSTGARVLEATAYAKQGNMKEAEEICASIQGKGDSMKSVTFQEDLQALLLVMKPHCRERRIKARSFEAKGMHREALLEYAGALKTADEEDGQMIREALFTIVRENPALGELPEEARKCTLRGEMLVNEGSFEKAAAEYRQAIRMAPYVAKLYFNAALIDAKLERYADAVRQMRIYLQAAPDAPDARAARDEVIKWEFMMEREK